MLRRRTAEVSGAQRNRYILAALLLASAPALAGEPEAVSHPSTDSSPAWAIADFNGDSRPDVIYAIEQGLASGGYEHRVELTLSGSRGKQQWPVTFFQEGVSISPLDVDWDGDLDLVFENVRSRTSLSVWLNDGSGLFRQIPPGLFDRSLIWEEPGIHSRRRTARPLLQAEHARTDSYAEQVRESSSDFYCGAEPAMARSGVHRLESSSASSPRAPPSVLS